MWEVLSAVFSPTNSLNSAPVLRPPLIGSTLLRQVVSAPTAYARLPARSPSLLERMRSSVGRIRSVSVPDTHKSSSHSTRVPNAARGCSLGRRCNRGTNMGFMSEKSFE